MKKIMLVAALLLAYGVHPSPAVAGDKPDHHQKRQGNGGGGHQGNNGQGGGNNLLQGLFGQNQNQNQGQSQNGGGGGGKHNGNHGQGGAGNELMRGLFGQGQDSAGNDGGDGGGNGGSEGGKHKGNHGHPQNADDLMRGLFGKDRGDDQGQDQEAGGGRKHKQENGRHRDGNDLVRGDGGVDPEDDGTRDAKLKGEEGGHHRKDKEVDPGFAGQDQEGGDRKHHGKHHQGNAPGDEAGAPGMSFSQAAVQLGQYSVVAMASSLQAVAKVQEATGEKTTSLLLQAQADEVLNMKEPKASVMERSLRAIENNPIKRENLLKVQNPRDKRKIVESLAYLAASAEFNSRAVSTAESLTMLKPGPADLLNAPALLEVTGIVITTFPKQLSMLADYTSEISAYASTNRLTPPTEEDSRRVAIENGADPSSLAELDAPN